MMSKILFVNKILVILRRGIQAVYKARNALNVAIASSTYFDKKLSKFLPYLKKNKNYNACTPLLVFL